MIVFDLACAQGHQFEGWFSSSNDYADQCQRGLLNCPQCGSAQITKSPMAPAIAAKGNQSSALAHTAQADKETVITNNQIPPEVHKAMVALAKAQEKALKNSTWVGDKFTETARAMHYGEQDLEAIHGKATLNEAKELLEEGVELAPLPFPIADADELN